jgi:iron complex transport system substrate-binding protein
MIVSTRPLVVVGSDTYLNELLETAGASNIAARYSSTYPTLSRETVVSEDPDLLLVTSDVVADTRQLLDEFPEWTSLTAVRRNRIYRVDADLVTRPGPRAVEALRLIAHLVHGETP